MLEYPIKITVSKDKPISIIIDEPSQRSIWNRWKDTLTAIGDGDLGTTIRKAIEGEVGVGQRTYRLIVDALINASINPLKIHHQDKLDKFIKLSLEITDYESGIFKSIEGTKIQLEPDFFIDPTQLDIVTTIQKDYRDWLMNPDGLNFSKDTAHILTLNFPQQFYLEIIKEWQRDGTFYQPIKNFFDNNPFLEHWEQRKAKMEYYEELRNLYTCPALGDKKINLSDVYIKPNFSIHKHCHKKSAYSNKEGFVEQTKFKDLHQYIYNNFLSSKSSFALKSEQSRFILLLGQPGQGKTSFCYRTIHNILSNPLFKEDLVFVRLQYANHTNFINQPFDEIRRLTPFEIGTNALVLLDGLDELYMSAGLSDNDIRDCFGNIQKELRNNRSWKILLTSRYNYVPISKLSEHETFIVNLQPITLEQQIKWLNIYRSYYSSCKLTENKLREINDKRRTNYKHIRELINQPILLHIVARTNVDISAKDNRATIYNKLFDILTKREWADKQLNKYQIDADELRDYLGTIALKIYHSSHEYISHYDLLKLPETKTFIDDNLEIDDHKDNEEKALKEALKDVLVSFYFRNVQKKSDDDQREDKKEFAIEFLHKSLQEYLAAERICKTIFEEFTMKKGRKYYLTDSDKALEIIHNTFHPKVISEELREYIIEILQTTLDKDEKKELADRLKYFLLDFVKQQFLFKASKNGYSIDKAMNCFIGYWLILSSLEQKENFIIDKIRPMFGKLLKFSSTVPYAFFNLSYQNLFYIKLQGITFPKSIFFKTVLIEADLRGAVLQRANLRAADLSGANLRGANLIEADLREAVLRKADLRKAVLRKAVLRKADLEGAVLIEADLEGANLIGADLSRADLSGAVLRGAVLIRAKVSTITFFEELVNLEHSPISIENLIKKYSVNPKIKGSIIKYYEIEEK